MLRYVPTPFRPSARALCVSAPVLLSVTIFVVHDLHPRAMSSKVHGFVQAQRRFQDLTRVSVGP